MSVYYKRRSMVVYGHSQPFIKGVERVASMRGLCVLINSKLIVKDHQSPPRSPTVLICLLHPSNHEIIGLLGGHLEYRCNRPDYTPAGLYPGILWPRPIYASGYITA